MFQKIQRTSARLFTLSFILNRLQLITGNLLGALLSISVLMINLMAYGCWLTASFMIPESSQDTKAWYGFAQFKHQNIGAAIAGMLSVLFFSGALFFPVLMVPGCWCVALSNLFWLSGEYHRYHNPSDWDTGSIQHVYLEYVGFMAAAGVSSAFLITVTLIFPASSVFILTLIGALSFFFAANATQYWLAQYNSTPPPEIKPFIDSTIDHVSRALHQLGYNSQPKKTLNMTPPAASAIIQSRKPHALQDQIGDKHIENSTVFK